MVYVILSRNGWSFASSGPYYIVTNPQGEVVVKDMAKSWVEREFFRLVKGA